MRCTCPFQLRKLAQSVRLSFGPRFFPCKLSRKITHVRCPCSFRLRRLAKSESPDPGFRFFCLRIFVQNCSCEMYMSISTAQTSTKSQSVRLSFGPWFFPCKFSREITLVKCPCECRLRKLAQSVPILGARQFSCKLSTQIVFARCPGAFRLRMLAAGFCSCGFAAFSL